MSDPYLPEGWTQDTIDEEYARQAEWDRTNAPRCRSCGAVLIWAVTDSGRRMPLDFDPVPNGNLVLSRDRDSPRAIVLSPGQQPHVSVPRYISHFSSCPHAKRFRRAR